MRDSNLEAKRILGVDVLIDYDSTWSSVYGADGEYLGQFGMRWTCLHGTHFVIDVDWQSDRLLDATEQDALEAIVKTAYLL